MASSLAAAKSCEAIFSGCLMLDYRFVPVSCGHSNRSYLFTNSGGVIKRQTKELKMIEFSVSIIHSFQTNFHAWMMLLTFCVAWIMLICGETCDLIRAKKKTHRAWLIFIIDLSSTFTIDRGKDLAFIWTGPSGFPYLETWKSTNEELFFVDFSKKWLIHSDHSYHSYHLNFIW